MRSFFQRQKIIIWISKKKLPKMSKKKISLHLNSNKPKDFNYLVESVVKTSFDISSIEIIVHIDKGDEKMKEIVNQVNMKNQNLVNVLETNIIDSFSDAWKTLNLLLKKTAPKVKIISCISDDLRFVVPDWDKKLLSYDNLFEDKIYRLRCSMYKNQKYVDIWQCGYAPDSYAFYSKKWLEIVNQWCPCIGPDSFHECISYYMSKISKKYDRNIVVKNVSFDGQSVSTGISLSTRLNRTRIYYKAFFTLMSCKNQRLALQNAKNIITNLKNYDKNDNLSNYNINYINHNLNNFRKRLNFFKNRGSPDHPINNIPKNIIFIVWCYVSFLDHFICKIIKYFYRKGVLEKIIKNKKQYENFKNIIKNEESKA